MDRRSKEMAARQQQEKQAAQEARTAHLRVIKEEMTKAREVCAILLQPNTSYFTLSEVHEPSAFN